MAIKLENKTNVVAPGGDYPYGRIKDNLGDGTGTPVDEAVYGDFHQFFAKLLAESGVTASGLPENSANGFDYIDALSKFINLNYLTDLVKAFIGTYTTNDLIVLYGCVVTANIPGTSAITAGAIYYNGNIYKVDANASISSPSNTLVFSVSTSVQPNKITLTNAATGTGIADYDDTTVKTGFPYGPWVSIAPNGTNTSGTSTFKYRKAPGNKVQIVGKVKKALNDTDYHVIVNMPVGFRPSTQKQFLVAGQALTGVLTHSLSIDSSAGTGNILLSGNDSFYSVFDFEYSLD